MTAAKFTWKIFGLLQCREDITHNGLQEFTDKHQTTIEWEWYMGSLKGKVYRKCSKTVQDKIPKISLSVFSAGERHLSLSIDFFY